MRALNDKDFPPLAREVLLQLQNWPGDPSLAVVGKDGVLACHDSGRVYRLASVTKLLTALTLLCASDEGLISLEDKVGPPGSSILHLLAHASGVGFADEQVRAPAGSRRIYSNTGIDLAAAHLASRTGKDFRDEMRIRVLEPLGMHNTKLAGAPSKGGEGTIADTARLAWELLNLQCSRRPGSMCCPRWLIPHWQGSFPASATRQGTTGGPELKYADTSHPTGPAPRMPRQLSGTSVWQGASSGWTGKPAWHVLRSRQSTSGSGHLWPGPTPPPQYSGPTPKPHGRPRALREFWQTMHSDDHSGPQ